jgi:alanyl-tRNA synthetase
MMQSAMVRQQFLDFFKSKGHTIVPSAPIVIKNDPTLLFTNAGMNQFKDYFLGNSPAPYSRVADTQKCLRVSGKHNDREEVGVDTYHHTMFEMLGNWSFGNASAKPAPYFKEQAIKWSWELLTKVYGIPVTDLYVSIFQGDEKEGLPSDDESYEYWKECLLEAGFSEAEIKQRIILGNKKDNFWEMGDTGPCGPCTEIHVDSRSSEEKKLVPGNSLVNQDDPQVIEIWNNVFIQYNRKKDGTLETLPAKHVDTGMGFERLVRVLQQKTSNYDTDIFSGTIHEIENISGKKYDASGSREAISFRVIADHIRAIAFPITDGQLPSNTGAGYVIRRILRRAVRYYFSYLNVRQPLLYKLIPALAIQYKDVFPELHQQQDFVAQVILEEENNFLRTLEAGLKRLDAVVDQSKTIDGKTVFELYDTYGFPPDLTNLIANENNWQVDLAGFEKEMQQQKNRSRAAAIMDTEDWSVTSENIENRFVGYNKLEATTQVIKYRSVKSKDKQLYQIVLTETPFYAESGGQVGDTGTLIFDGEKIPVINTKKENDLILHFTEKLPAEISGPVEARVDSFKRQNTAIHHSATHLLHAALRSVLGKHVQQKGSLVNDEYLRFDFSHFTKMTAAEVREVENKVNEKIRENVPVVIREMPRDEALASGAMALFGEKYGERVRVVVMDPNYSIELCGGTHIGHTGEIGYFKIINETAVGAGLRRIEAVSGKAADDYVQDQIDVVQSIKESLKNPKNLLSSIQALQLEKEQLNKTVNDLTAQLLEIEKDRLMLNVQEISGISFIGAVVSVANAEALKKLCLMLTSSLDNYLIVLAADIQGKASVAVAASKNFQTAKDTDAVKIIRQIVAPLIKGGGGGQPAFATAGGQDVSQLNQVVEKVKALL